MPGVVQVGADKSFNHVPFPQANAFLLQIRWSEDCDFIERALVPDIKIVVGPDAARGGRNFRDRTALFQSAFDGYSLRFLPERVAELAIQFEIAVDSLRL